MAKWEKGQSGNPGGRPKEIGDVRELAREHTEEAVIATLVEIMQDKQAPHSARVRASDSLLDRGYGRPPQALEHTGANGGAIHAKVTTEIQALSLHDQATLEHYYKHRYRPGTDSAKETVIQHKGD